MSNRFGSSLASGLPPRPPASTGGFEGSLVMGGGLIRLYCYIINIYYRYFSVLL